MAAKRDSLDHVGNAKRSQMQAVQRFPARIRCATLPWKALLAALTQPR
jgi:NifU-like protein involved in Fe-S cluster formation